METNTKTENRSPGTVYLIGAGPGDPGLITVKGLEKIRIADVVIYDYLADERLIREAKATAELIYVGKTGSKHTLEQPNINELLVQKAMEGKNVRAAKRWRSLCIREGRGGSGSPGRGEGTLRGYSGCHVSCGRARLRGYSRHPPGSRVYGHFHHRSRRPDQRRFSH